MDKTIGVKCRCGRIVDVEIDNSEYLRETGIPKHIGDKDCECGQKIIVFASLYFPTSRYFYSKKG